MSDRCKHDIPLSRECVRCQNVLRKSQGLDPLPVPTPTPPEVRMCEGCMPWCGADCAGKPTPPGLPTLDFDKAERQSGCGHKLITDPGEVRQGGCMTLDLTAIQARVEAAHQETPMFCLVGGHNPPCQRCSCGEWVKAGEFTNHRQSGDIPALLQEIERLTAERDDFKLRLEEYEPLPECPECGRTDTHVHHFD